jgi:amino acid permease
MKNILIIISVLVGIAFIVIGVIYLKDPAGSLPTYFPGFEAGSDHVHLKHGIASILLALGSFVLAWFKSGENRAD